jgi:fucose permease
VLTALMGFISDQYSIRFAMLIPAAAFIVVALFGLSARTSDRVLAAHPVIS